MDDLEVVKVVSRECGLPQYQTHEVFNSLASIIHKRLQNQQSITIRGLGTFYIPNQSMENDNIRSSGGTIKYYVTHVPEQHPSSI